VGWRGVGDGGGDGGVDDGGGDDCGDSGGSGKVSTLRFLGILSNFR